jgi:hypothetical protein
VQIADISSSAETRKGVAGVAAATGADPHMRRGEKMKRSAHTAAPATVCGVRCRASDRWRPSPTTRSIGTGGTRMAEGCTM